MANMRMPYQCMEKCGNFLVAARGSNIDLFSLSDGSFLSTWQCPAIQAPQKAKTATVETKPKLENQESQTSSVETVVDTTAPPAKRRKLSNEEGQDEKSVKGAKEEVTGAKKQTKKEKKQNNRSESVTSGLDAPAVIALAVTSDSQHVIAITGEDKSIRVFSVISQDGNTRLDHLSHRPMPKRPSALAISADNTTILSADKFGDVYSLPLLPTPPSIPPTTTLSTSSPAPAPFKPSANLLTIHSQRNVKALENQQRQTKNAPKPPKAEQLDFEHTLLLGHVSLLTDIKLARSGARTYVVTADRDEHIRISRGIPQTHVIEGFCLGHREFISRICIPGSRPELLISGGGDDEVFVWEWERGVLVSKVELKTSVEEVVGVKVDKIAVSGIWHTRRANRSGEVDVVIVTVEGVPALLVFFLGADNSLKLTQVLALTGNPLSLVPEIQKPDSTSDRVIVSVDNIHKPGSTTELRDSNEEAVSPFQAFVYEDPANEILRPDSFTIVAVEGESMTESVVGGLKNLLYSLENLRKRDGEERGKEGENGVDVVMGEGQSARVDE